MALEGTLHDMSLPDLIQVFRMGPKTGILLLVGGTERGVVYVSEGRMIDAVVVRGTERTIVATGEEAILHLLQWEEGAFTFRHDLSTTQRPVRIIHDGEWLVLEGMRRRENPIRLLPHQQITETTHLELAPLPSSAESGVNLDLDQWRLLSQVSISQNMNEICEKTGMTMEKAIRTASELVAIGLIEIVEVSAPPPRRTPTSHALQERPVDPTLVGIPAVNGTVSTLAEPPGRGLLSAIMRRIRGL